MLAYDRVLNANLMAGARVGYAFAGAGPVAPGGKAFFPAHIEARVSYWLGTDPFIRVGVRPFLVAGFGAAQFDGKVTVRVYNQSMGSIDAYNMDAWRKVGTMFATAGVGMMYALDHDSGIVGEVKGSAGLPTTGFAASLQVGYSRGFF